MTPEKTRSGAGALAMLLMAATLMPRTTGVATAGSRGHWRTLFAAAHLPTLYRPTGLGLNGHGDLYVLDSGNFRVVKLSPHGAVLARFGSRGTRPGQFGPVGQGPDPTRIGPSSLAVDLHGDVYVVDIGNQRLEKFSPSGRFLVEWNFSVPDARVWQAAVAVGTDGAILLAVAVFADCANGCASYYVVQRCSSGLTLLGQWVSQNPVPTLGRDARGAINQISITAGPGGTTYVGISGLVNCYKSCPNFSSLEKRSAGGRLLAHWDGHGFQNVLTPVALAVGGRGNLFVADSSTHGIQKRTSGGRVLVSWERFGAGPRLSLGANGIAIDARGNIYLSDTGNGRILKLSSSAKPLAGWGTGGSSAGRFWSPSGVAVDGRGHLWVTSNGVPGTRVRCFAPDGRLLQDWTVPNGSRPLALDRVGNVYLAQRVRHRVVVERFSPRGKVLARWGSLHLASQPTGLAIDKHGNVVMLAEFDVHNDLPNSGLHALTLSPAGKRLVYFPVPFDVLGSVVTLTQSSIAVDGQDNVYLLDTYGHHLVKLGPRGAGLAVWHTAIGSSREVGPLASGIVLDRRGDIYFSDTTDDFVEEIAPTGEKLAVLGSPGIVPGQFHHPAGVALDSHGAIYVADTGSNRIQRFTP